MRSWASGGSASSPSGHTISSEGSWVREKEKFVGIVRGDAEKEKYKEGKKGLELLQTLPGTPVPKVLQVPPLLRESQQSPEHSLLLDSVWALQTVTSHS